MMSTATITNSATASITVASAAAAAVLPPSMNDSTRTETTSVLNGRLPLKTEVVSVRVLSFIEGGNTAAAAALATVMLAVALFVIVAVDIIQRKVARRG